MRRSGIAAVFAVLMGAVACSDSTSPEANRGGTGTTTLQVIADINAGDNPGGYVTDFDVSVRDAGGGAVSGATVTIQHSFFGTVTLLETSPGSGDYFASRNRYPTSGEFRLDVVRGSDNVRDVVVGSLGLHNITSPAVGATMPANQPLTVRWSAAVAAQSIDLETQDYSIAGLPDNGSATIPGADNPPRPDQRIRVFRNNVVNATGGLGGSRLELSVRDTVEPVTIQ